MLTQPTPIAFSGNIPVFYDSYLGPMFFEPFALNMADRISKFNSSHLLELASGTGRLTKLLPVVASDAKIIASDINPAMVNYGKTKTEGTAIQWLEIDAVSLPFSDEAFDLVAVQFGVMFYSDRVKAFKEAWRVLKPGGTMIFNCWDKIENNPMAEIANNALHHFFPNNTPAFYSVHFSYYDEVAIYADLKKAGFRNVEMELMRLLGYSKSPSDAAKGLIEGTPTITAIEERDPDTVPEFMKYLETKISERFGNGTMQVPLQARVVVATKR